MTGLCADGCGRPAVALGYARPCYKRWDRAGRPDDGPPPPVPAAERTATAIRANREALAGRVEDYAEARAWGDSIVAAARWTGISISAAYRYEQVISSRQEASDAA